MLTREGARGQEYNAWGGEGGNPPEHETILFFTRMLAGPMDFTSDVAEIYADGPEAHWLTNPLPVAISEQNVNSDSSLTLVLAPGGGQAIRIRPAP